MKNDKKKTPFYAVIEINTDKILFDILFLV